MTGRTLDVLGGFKMPIVGFGTFTIIDEKELEDALDAALEVGYRHIDTATLYNNEHIIGRVLKKWFASGKLKREEVFVTTKLPGSGVHPDRVEGFMKKSLDALGLDYVDLYLIHFPICIKPSKESYLINIEVEPSDLIGVWKKMEEQVDAGRTKTIGVSNFNAEQIGRILNIARIKPASLQVELHVYLQQRDLVKYCQENGIVVVSYYSLGNPGLGKWLAKTGRTPDPDRPNLLDDPTVKQIAEKHKKSPAQILLRFLIDKNIAVIPKSVTPARIKENFNLFDFAFDQDDITALDDLDKGEKGRLSTFLQFKGFMDHHEYPFPKPV